MDYSEFAHTYALEIESLLVMERTVELHLHTRNGLIPFRIEVFQWLPGPSESSRYRPRIWRQNEESWSEEKDLTGKLTLDGDWPTADSAFLSAAKGIMREYCPSHHDAIPKELDAAMRGPGLRNPLQ